MLHSLHTRREWHDRVLVHHGILFALACSGSWGDFRTEYEHPLVQADSEAERSPLVVQLLGRIGRHYIRRMKQDVLQDLPAKEDIHIEVGLSENQLSLYRRIAQQGRSGAPGAALKAIHELLMVSAHPATVTMTGHGIYLRSR